MSLRNLAVLACATGGLALTAAGLCYTLQSPQPGYIAGLEAAPCTAYNANGCSNYLSEPPARVCKLVWIGMKPCLPGTRTAVYEQYANGFVPINSLCCQSGAYVGPSTTQFTQQWDSVGGFPCFVFVDEPK